MNSFNKFNIQLLFTEINAAKTTQVFQEYMFRKSKLKLIVKS